MGKMEIVNKINLLFLIVLSIIIACVAYFVFDIEIQKFVVLLVLLIFAIGANSFQSRLHSKAYGKKYYKGNSHRKRF